MRNRGKLRAAIFLGLAALVSIISNAQSPAKTLTRVEDFVQFTGKDVPGLIGSETRDLHLYACSGGSLEPIPFQADKRDSDGRYVFPNDEQRDPLRDGSRLDDNDELVFMVKDAGGRCSRAWADGASRGVEIEISDPVDGGRAWAYLFERPGRKAPPVEDYVSYRVEDGEEYVTATNYIFGQPLGYTYYDLIRLRRPDGSFGEDLLDMLKVGMKARLLNGSIPVIIPEQEIRARTFGTIDGPVRVIRDEMDYVYVKMLNINWNTEYFITYYMNGNISPVEFSVPVHLHRLFLEVKFYWALDLNETMNGAVMKNPSNPKGIILDGVQDKEYDRKSDNSYMTITGPQGSMIDSMVLEEELGRQMIRTTYLDEDPSRTEPGEDHPGQLQAGFWLQIEQSLNKGSYKYWFYHYYPYPFGPGKIEEIMNMIERPLQFSARPLNPPG